ncbi:hypothetical protein ACIQYF_05900 [Pseudomonas sp. NPDC096917]|uniref:hypothetical protein n=1 Tax=Pseudomonas sp. NPDC096917 TaxID=3364483 RepID=UPI00383B349A
MPTESEDDTRIPLLLAHRVGQGADPANVADAIIATLQAIDTALAPIIGRKGVTALFRRSLHLCESSYPDLVDALDSGSDQTDYSGLSSIIGTRTQEEALLLGEQLLRTLYQLLTSLIGVSLTARLLDAVFDAPLSALQAQDISR